MGPEYPGELVEADSAEEASPDVNSLGTSGVEGGWGAFETGPELDAAADPPLLVTVLVDSDEAEVRPDARVCALAARVLARELRANGGGGANTSAAEASLML